MSNEKARRAHRDSSWEHVAATRPAAAGFDGSYYHEHIVLPGVLRLLDCKGPASLLDLACGSGVLGRRMDPSVEYTGVDLSKQMIDFAAANDTSPHHRYLCADAAKPLGVAKTDFTHAAIVLALQNTPQPDLVLRNAFLHLRPAGRLAIVLNHPCFRIPRHSSWDVDPEKHVQSRRVERYMAPLKIPIRMNPSLGERSETTWSYHYPLSYYCEGLFNHRFRIVKIEEWISDKQSQGKNAPMENRSRREFPLFLAILAEKMRAQAIAPDRKH